MTKCEVQGGGQEKCHFWRELFNSNSTRQTETNLRASMVGLLTGPLLEPREQIESTV